MSMTASTDVDAAAQFVLPPAIHGDWGAEPASVVSSWGVVIDFPLCVDSGDVFDELVDIEDIFEEFSSDPRTRDHLVNASRKVARDFYGEEGESLRVLRLRAGMSQAQLAKAIGTSQPNIARLEAGSGTDVKRQTLRNLATALGTDLAAVDNALELAAQAATRKES